MKLFYLVPIVVGLCTVVQGALNKQLSQQWGLSWALVITSVLVLLFSFMLLWSGAYAGEFQISSLKWWHFVPALCGFLIILGIPLSIGKVGALSTFLLIIASQIVVSGMWDRFVEGMTLSWTRVLGAFVTMVGVWLASK